jgi:hypothetical protein
MIDELGFIWFWAPAPFQSAATKPAFRIDTPATKRDYALRGMWQNLSALSIVPHHQTRADRPLSSGPAMRVITGTLIALILAGAPRAASGHHGIVNFDMNREIEVTGTVTRLAFVNPHSWLYFDVTGTDGQVTSWRCELRGATVLRRSGWTPDMFAAGTRVTVTGAPDRFEANTCYLGTAVFGDGRRVDRYGQITQSAAAAAPSARPLRTPDGRPNLSGEWAAEQRVLTDPRGISGAFLPLSVARELAPGAVPEGAQAFPGTRGTAVSQSENPVDEFWNRRPSIRPLTAAGARAIEGFDGASADNPRLRCEPTNILFDWTFEADVNRITHQADRILMVYGSMGLRRTIYLNMSEHPRGLAPSRAGHSIGRWDGEALEVDTVGFEPGILSADGRLPHSDRLHVRERFTMDEDGRALRRSWVARDPPYFEGEYAGSDVVYISDVPYQVTPCEDLSYKSPGEGGSPSRVYWSAAAGIAGLVLVGWTVARRRISRQVKTRGIHTERDRRTGDRL